MVGIAKLTEKYQATVPRKVREFLGIGKGDRILFEIENEQVVLKKVTPLELDYYRSLESTMPEWNSPFDDEAYGDL